MVSACFCVFVEAMTQFVHVIIVIGINNVSLQEQKDVRLKEKEKNQRMFIIGKLYIEEETAILDNMVRKFLK